MYSQLSWFWLRWWWCCQGESWQRSCSPGWRPSLCRLPAYNFIFHTQLALTKCEGRRLRGKYCSWLCAFSVHFLKGRHSQQVQPISNNFQREILIALSKLLEYASNQASNLLKSSCKIPYLQEVSVFKLSLNIQNSNGSSWILFWQPCQSDNNKIKWRKCQRQAAKRAKETILGWLIKFIFKCQVLWLGRDRQRERESQASRNLINFQNKNWILASFEMQNRHRTVESIKWMSKGRRRRVFRVRLSALFRESWPNNSFDTHSHSPQGGSWLPCPGRVLPLPVVLAVVVVVFMADASCGRALCYCSHGNEY